MQVQTFVVRYFKCPTCPCEYKFEPVVDAAREVAGMEPKTRYIWSCNGCGGYFVVTSTWVSGLSMEPYTPEKA